MNRRKFMCLVGIAVVGVPSIAGLRKPAKPAGIVWQGSNEESFSDPETVTYVETFRGVLVFMTNPKHRYIRFVSDNPNESVSVATGGHMFLGYRLTGNDILDIAGFDWQRYKKRIGNLRRDLANG